MTGLITFVVGASVGGAAIVAWGITRWRTGRAARGRRW
jgi:hypothetical protein